VVLSALLVYGLGLTSHLTQEPAAGEMRVRVTGEMWWWRVGYLDGAGREVLQDANELHIPVGRPVVLELDSADVIHSLWIPRLSGKVDMIPGRRNLMRVQADAPGAYGGQCAEYCGGPHALMGLHVVAEDPARFEAWRMAQRAGAAQAPARGRTLFESHCSGCHTVRGTPAAGTLGPDLTHVGSRIALAAAALPNDDAGRARWIAAGQHVKPGNLMPQYAELPADDLAALAAYLAALR